MSSHLHRAFYLPLNFLSRLFPRGVPIHTPFQPRLHAGLHEGRDMSTLYPPHGKPYLKNAILSVNPRTSLLPIATQSQLRSHVRLLKFHLWNSLLWSRSSHLPLPFLGWPLLFFIPIFQKQLLTLCCLSHPDKDIANYVWKNVSINWSSPCLKCVPNLSS